jgi:hypothetical protein
MKRDLKSPCLAQAPSGLARVCGPEFQSGAMMEENFCRYEEQAGYGNVKAGMKVVAWYILPCMYGRNSKPQQQKISEIDGESE